MTAVVGILCKEGVVIGADSSVTFASGQIRTIEQKARKIEIINNRYIVAGTGQVGLGQRFNYELNCFFDSSTNRNLPPVEMCRKISHVSITNFTSSKAPTGFGALLAFPSPGNTHNLCEFDVNSFQPELKTNQIWYVSMGCGQALTDPFLGFIRKIFWSKGMPSLSEGIFATIWTLQHAVDLNTGGINEPIDIAILEKIDDKYVARFIEKEEMEEHINYIKELEEHISIFKRIDKVEINAELPTLGS